jgi:hypothetical protein
MGEGIFHLRVSKEGGSITLTRTNVLITLAPYFFPLYTVLVITGYYVLSVFFKVDEYYLVWLALVGLTWGFHVTFTITTLLQHQRDVHLYGRVLSYALIYLLNVVGVGLWVVLVSSATLEQMVGLLQERIVDEFALVRDGVVLAANAVGDWLMRIRNTAP